MGPQPVPLHDPYAAQGSGARMPAGAETALAPDPLAFARKTLDDLERLSRAWQGNSLTETQEFSVTLKADQVEAIVKLYKHFNVIDSDLRRIHYLSESSPRIELGLGLGQTPRSHQP